MGQWRRSEFFRSFPRFLGNWLAGDAVSYPILETGWLAQEVRFPTQTILLYTVIRAVHESEGHGDGNGDEHARPLYSGMWPDYQR